MDIHQYEPSSITAKVGNFDLVYDPNDKSKFSATIDGIDMRMVRKIEIVIETNKMPLVRCEFVPRSKGE